MSEGYWKGSLTHVAAGYASGKAARSAADAPPDAPEQFDDLSRSEDGGYWQGRHRAAQIGSVPETPHGSSVTARARRAYAAEALRVKDHVSAGLLAIFLGVFGVHKFYLGCNQAGFIMLAVSIIGGILTFGLAAAVIEVIAVIEGITYLSKSQTEFDRSYVLNQRDWF